MASNMINASYFSPTEVKFLSGNDGILGEGGFGTVVIGKLDVLEIVAIKCIRIAGSKRGFEIKKEKFANEVKLMQQATHKNVVKLVGYTSWLGRMGIIMEHMPGGSLSTLLFKVRSDIPPIIRLQFCHDITHGMTYLHHGFKDKRMTHSDLKPGNVLLTFHLTCKIADFGGAHYATHSENATQKKKAKWIEYTRAYAAPERLESLGSSTPTSKPMDVYSVGMIFRGILLRKKCPSQEQQEVEIAIDQLKSQYSKIFDVKIIDVIREKMDESTSENPGERPSMMKIRDDLSVLYSEVNVSDLLRHVFETSQNMQMKLTIPPQAILESIDKLV